MWRFVAQMFSDTGWPDDNFPRYFAARRKPQPRRGRKTSFRVGKVHGDQRGNVWYLTYFEDGRRYRPRIGADREEAQQHAAQINAQLTTHVPVASSFQSIAITDLRERWLEYHEHVARSSVQTIRRYRAATEHFVRFLNTHRVPLSTGRFSIEHAEQFAKSLRSIRVSPNGHPHSKKRLLLDKGVQYILECCRSLFGYALKCRHLPPYAENPFSALRLDRSTNEAVRPIVLLSSVQERQFLECCDDWQFRQWFLIDCDPLRAQGHKKDASSDDEKAEAFKTMKAVALWLCKEQRWPQPIVADSGNGSHLLFRVLLLPDGDLLHKVLLALAAKFDTPAVSIDTAVANSSRICRLHGTTNCKGEPTAERPHRRSDG